MKYVLSIIMFLVLINCIYGAPAVIGKVEKIDADKNIITITVNAQYNKRITLDQIISIGYNNKYFPVRITGFNNEYHYCTYLNSDLELLKSVKSGSVLYAADAENKDIDYKNRKNQIVGKIVTVKQDSLILKLDSSARSGISRGVILGFINKGRANIFKVYKIEKDYAYCTKVNKFNISSPNDIKMKNVFFYYEGMIEDKTNKVKRSDSDKGYVTCAGFMSPLFILLILMAPFF